MAKRSQQRYVDPTKYEIGVDITQEKFDEVLVGVTDWFAEWRNSPEPAALARQALRECLLGVTKDGDPWFSAATASLEKRIKMKCRFDIAAMEPLRSGRQKSDKEKQWERDRQARRRAEREEDPLIPKELRDEQAGKQQVVYGTDPHVLMSSEEQRRWQNLRDSYVQQFPELGSVNAEAELNLLCDLHVLTERFRLSVLSGKKVSSFDRKAVADDLQALKKALGIHPDQLAKRVEQKETTSVAAAAARLEAMGNWRALRERFWVEELLQLFQMFMTRSADGLTYQLDEVGLFGLTRSKPCACPKCGQRVFAGLSIDEIEAYLVKKGVLKRVEPVLALPPGSPEGSGDGA